MRGLVKIGGEWQKVTLTEDPQLLDKWLWRHDGNDAVCIDDAKQVYYCGTYELRDKYKEGGKKALMFYDLGVILHGRTGKTSDIEYAPTWCATTETLCSNKLPGSICQHCEEGK